MWCLETVSLECLGQRSLNSQSPPHTHMPRRVLPSTFLFVTLNLILDPGMVIHLDLGLLYRGSPSLYQAGYFPFCCTDRPWENSGESCVKSCEAGVGNSMNWTEQIMWHHMVMLWDMDGAGEQEARLERQLQSFLSWAVCAPRVCFANVNRIL